MTTLFLLVALCSCNDLEHDGSNGLDTSQEIYGPADSTLYYLTGTYHGTLPTPYTAGIAGTLILNKDHTVYLHCEDEHDENRIFNENGIFTYHEDTLSIHLEGSQQIYYLIERNRLKMLSRYKKEITGLSKDQYVFHKMQNL